MSLDKVLIFLAVIVASILHVTAYNHYVSDTGIVYITAALYCIQIALCIKYILDGKFSFYSFLILLIMVGIISEYFDFNHWPGVAILKSIWAIAYIIIAGLFFRKTLHHHTHFSFIDNLTLPVAAILLAFQATTFIIDLFPVEWFFNKRELYLAILLMGNTVNYAIIALMVTILLNNKYRLLMVPGEIRIITLIALICTLPIIENFFNEFLASI